MNDGRVSGGEAGRRPVAILPSELVNQIAAGEVVERPASVVKELVENALDAGATAIDVRLEQGGKKLIEVLDDGSGMSEADARLAIERHATSKIAGFDDLVAVRTLGFRGEALPSIASVSHFHLVTWDGESEHGAEIESYPGEDLVARPASRARGTTVTVRNLFGNVPARRKFLKSTDAEYRAVVAVVWSYALPSPGRSFRVEHNGRVVIDLPAVSTARERVVQVLGDEVEPDLSPIEFAIEDVSASGFVTRSSPFGSRRNQYYFVNGRMVRDKVLTHAASRATGAFQASSHPAIVLFLALDPGGVDVNVHPAKTEVRFRDSGRIHVVVEQGIRRAIGSPEEGSGLLDGSSAQERVAGRPPLTVRNGSGPAASGWIGDGLPQVEPGRAFEPRWDATPLFRDRPVVQPPVESGPVDLGDLQGRVIGQYRHSYIVIDAPDGLRLIDQHVAHERVLYDRIAAKMGDGTAESQRLLDPWIWEPGAAAFAAVESHLDELRAAGFEIEPFSAKSFAVSSVPTLLGREQVEAFFKKLLDASLDRGSSHLSTLREKLMASLACQAAIKVHYPLSGEAMSRLVGDLLASSNPYACPHGRPIIVDIRHADIEKHFFRK